MELRTTEEERALIDQAVSATGSDLTAFVVSSAVNRARDVLADREVVVLDAEAQAWWEEINARPARDLPSLREFMARPSPWEE